MTLKLGLPWYLLVKSGKKPVEIRCLDEKRKLIKVGDELTFTATDGRNPFTKKVKSLKTFTSFRDALKDATLERALPGYESLDDAVELYHSFPGYKEKEKDGVLAIELE